MYSTTINQILEHEGKTTPTLIQSRSYQAIRDGESVVGLAKTGSGKTLAYCLPILETTPRGATNHTVIFEPTTELAIQTRNAMAPYAKALKLTTLTLVGAGNRKRQLEQLKKKTAEVLIVTPGRFFDLFSANKIKVAQIKSLIIDEADDILEFETTDLLSALGQNLSDDSQILLFGASESAQTKDCEALFNRSFLRIDVRQDQKTTVQHGFLQVSNQYKLEYLQRLAKVDGFKGILFFNKDENMRHFARIFSHSKTHFDLLSNEQSKLTHERVLSRLASGEIKLLFATDLAARGLDISDLSYVVNFEIPEDRNTYIHRAGRTGRMNAKGNVVTLGDDHDFRDLKKLLAGYGELERVYFDGFSLATKLPEKRPVKSVEKKVIDKIKRQELPEKSQKHKKIRLRQRKDKGYHPRQRKEKR